MAIGYWSWSKAVFYRLLILVASNALLKLTGTHLVIQPLLWALLKGVVSGVFVSLLMPWVFSRLRLVPAHPQ